MAKQTTIHAEVDRPTKVAIQKLAKDSKVSVSVIVRWALQEYIVRKTDLQAYKAFAESQYKEAVSA